MEDKFTADIAHADDTIKWAKEVLDRVEKGLARMEITTKNALKEFDQAIKLAKEYLNVYKDDVYVLLQLGFAYKQIGDYENAINICNYVLSIDSYNPVARLDLFDIYMETEQYDVAAPIIDEIFTSPMYETILKENRAKYEEARETINKYLETQKLKINA